MMKNWRKFCGNFIEWTGISFEMEESQMSFPEEVETVDVPPEEVLSEVKENTVFFCFVFVFLFLSAFSP